MVDFPYSTKTISKNLLNEIAKDLEGLDYGSIEIYVTAHKVTQITKRRIKKTAS